MSAAARPSPRARRAKIYAGTERNLTRLARALAAGELVAVPTETVYGLAGDALNPEAARAIFRAKGRPSNDPLIVHVHGVAEVEELAETSNAFRKVSTAFWPGPLTVVLAKKSIVPDIVTSGGPSVAIRCPAHPLFRKLLKKCGRPLAAPSANPFGYISPTTAEHVAESLGDRIDYILDGGAAKIGVESSIIDLRNPKKPKVLRPGAISRSDLERVLGSRVTERRQLAKAKTRAAAPGMLSRHYSPRTRLTLANKLRVSETALRPKEAWLFFKKPARVDRAAKNIFWLSESGNLNEAAKNLFAQLRKLDRAGWKQLHAERAPGEAGLARAINDRLSR
ncbi:MAG TPA: L-threonylcarbamoyladenylate synthase, partial [Opitutaceae bacterium]